VVEQHPHAPGERVSQAHDAPHPLGLRLRALEVPVAERVDRLAGAGPRPCPGGPPPAPARAPRGHRPPAAPQRPPRPARRPAGPQASSSASSARRFAAGIPTAIIRPPARSECRAGCVLCSAQRMLSRHAAHASCPPARAAAPRALLLLALVLALPAAARGQED